MTQEYCGANQIGLLQALSQSGTRHDDRKVHAQPRYMNTGIKDVTHLLFNKDECDILERVEEDGKLREPKLYAPTIPLILINGTKGIGTGYSTEVPTFGIQEVIHECKNIANGRECDMALSPKTEGFNGDIIKESASSFIFKGKMELLDEKWVEGRETGFVYRIYELPPQVWSNPLKESLEKISWVKEVVPYATCQTKVDLRAHVNDESEKLEEYEIKLNNA